MVSPEESNVRTEPAPSIQEVINMPEVPYNEYWQEFANLGEQRVEVAASQAAAKLEGLEERMLNPGRHSRNGNNVADRISTNDVVEEWYLSLGGFNSLIGSQADMRLAAANLWHRAGSHHLTEEDKVVRFTQDLNDMKADRIPEQLRGAVHDKNTLDRLGMAGQVMLDVARIPTLSTLEKHNACKEAMVVNATIVDLLANASELHGLTDRQERVLSDALKAKYDAWFEAKSVEHGIGSISDEDYYRQSAAILKIQVQETIHLAGGVLRNGQVVDCTISSEARDNALEMQPGNLSNGDLLESYYNALMRYTLNVSPGEQRFLLQTATRRQDSPHDNFKHMNLPRYAFDAKIVDEKGEMQQQIVQLKTHKNNGYAYADGMLMVDQVLISDDNQKQRREMLTGLSQIFGLTDELAKNERGHISQFGVDVLQTHQRNVEAILQGASV